MSRSKPLSEYEIFVGNILGQTGGQSKRQRENSISLRDNFRNLLRYTVNRIYDENEEASDDRLARTLACLAVATNGENPSSADVGRGSHEQMMSFGYVAAAVCLWELEHVVFEMPVPANTVEFAQTPPLTAPDMRTRLARMGQVQAVVSTAAQ
jgi:hypothetical protein